MGKKYVNVGIEDEQFDWLTDQVREGRFASISHGIRVALKKLMEVK
jgi:Arc/MetJ-type ribon-helix-helix transcriptional regulator